MFVGGAMVRSAMPEDRRAMATQKLRWETGQIHTWMKLPGMMMRLAEARGDSGDVGGCWIGRCRRWRWG